MDFGRTIATEELPFKPLAPNVNMRVVYIDDSGPGWTVMINALPGSVLPRHQHLSQAEIYILKGKGNHPQTGDYKTGDYVIEPANAIHDAVLFEEEVLLIMKSTGDVAFIDDDGNTMFMMDKGMLTGFAAAPAA
ncbi:MAG: cupin domain-containing protein [Actinomycetes bacterium]